MTLFYDADDQNSGNNMNEEVPLSQHHDVAHRGYKRKNNKKLKEVKGCDIQEHDILECTLVIPGDIDNFFAGNEFEWDDQISVAFTTRCRGDREVYGRSIFDGNCGKGTSLIVENIHIDNVCTAHAFSSEAGEGDVFSQFCLE